MLHGHRVLFEVWHNYKYILLNGNTLIYFSNRKTLKKDSFYNFLCVFALFCSIFDRKLEFLNKILEA